MTGEKTRKDDEEKKKKKALCRGLFPRQTQKTLEERKTGGGGGREPEPPYCLLLSFPLTLPLQRLRFDLTILLSSARLRGFADPRCASLQKKKKEKQRALLPLRFIFIYPPFQSRYLAVPHPCAQPLYRLVNAYVTAATMAVTSTVGPWKTAALWPPRRHPPDTVRL